MLVLYKGKAMPEGTRSKHGGVPVIKRHGKWVRYTGDKKASAKDAKKEKKSGKKDEAWKSYKEGEFIPSKDLPDKLAVRFGEGKYAKTYRVSKDRLDGGIKKWGRLFFLHDKLDTYEDPKTGEKYKAILDEKAVTEASTGRKLPSHWTVEKRSKEESLKRTLGRLEDYSSKEDFDESAKNRGTISEGDVPEDPADFPERKIHHHGDKATREVAQELSDKISQIPGEDVTADKIKKTAKKMDVYLPNFVEEYEDRFGPKEWQVAFNMHIDTDDDLNRIPEITRIADEYNLDTIQVANLWKKVYGVPPMSHAPGAIEADIHTINKYGHPNPGDISEALASAVKNNMELDDAWEQKFGPLDTDTDQKEDSGGFYTDRGTYIPDELLGESIHGHPLEQEDIEAAVEWSKGNDVSNTRTMLRWEYDRTIDDSVAQDYVPSSLAKSMSQAFEGAARFTGDETLYRGTPDSLKWLNMQAGDEVPFGAGSFTRDYRQAVKFSQASGGTGERGVKIVMEADPEHEDVGLYGVDIDAMHEKATESSWAEKNSIEIYDDEKEVIARASHLRIKEVDKDGATVYVEPVYRGMHLNKAVKDADSMRIYEVMRDFDQIFNQSLGEQRQSLKENDYNVDASEA